MIELERDESQDVELWADVEFRHVIVHETPESLPHRLPVAGFYVRDENAEEGPFPTLDIALEGAHAAWDDAVALGPALRLERDIARGRADEVGHFLLEYLADYGAAGIDVQTLASQVFARIGDDEEAWG